MGMTSREDEIEAFLVWFKEQCAKYPMTERHGPYQYEGISERRCPTPPTMREIREARLRIEREAPSGPALRERLLPKSWLSGSADVRPTQMHGTNEPSGPTGETLRIGHVTIRGLRWGHETHLIRERGIMEEMLKCPDVFSLRDMQKTSRNSNSSITIDSMADAIVRNIETPNVIMFKVGITWNPPYRWIHPKYGYNDLGYHRMVLLGTDHDARVCGIYESIMIRIFGEYDRCDNCRQGDDNRQEVSPQYVYLALKLRQPERYPC